MPLLLRLYNHMFPHLGQVVFTPSFFISVFIVAAPHIPDTHDLHLLQVSILLFVKYVTRARWQVLALFQIQVLAMCDLSFH